MRGRANRLFSVPRCMDRFMARTVSHRGGEVDEHTFLRPKSREDVERAVLEAAKIYWMARRDIEPLGR